MNFERKTFIFRSSHPQVFYKKVAHNNLSKFTCNLFKKETPTQVNFCEFSEILYLAEHLRIAGSGFSTVFNVALHNLFHQAE